MIKVFLVEDEAVIRRGIRDSLDWAGNGFAFAGEAGDGEYAFPLILKTEPDILITDVKMPFMDGLELSGLVRKELPQTRIIILSGYDVFDYAKEAIRLGITDYLVKPITSVGLLEVLKRTADMIREERERKSLLERYFVSYDQYNEFLDCTDYSGVDRRVVNDFLRLGAEAESQAFIEEYFEAVGSHNYQSLLLRQYITMDIFYCVQEFLSFLQIGREDIPEDYREIRKIPKIINEVGSTKAYLGELFEYAIRCRDERSGNRYGSLIESARAYIADHYMDKEISLTTTAGHVGISPSYFSSIFKQETGKSFVEYLSEVRIDRACKLLRCTGLRTSEICEQVGYADAHYFSSAFKKAMGMSPKDYRAEGMER